MNEYEIYPFKKTFLQEKFGNHFFVLKIFSDQSEMQKYYEELTFYPTEPGDVGSVVIPEPLIDGSDVPNTDMFCTMLLGTQRGTMTITHEAAHIALYHEEFFETCHDYFGDDGECWGYERLPYKVGYIARAIVDLLYKEGFYKPTVDQGEQESP